MVSNAVIRYIINQSWASNPLLHNVMWNTEKLKDIKYISQLQGIGMLHGNTFIYILPVVIWKEWVRILFLIRGWSKCLASDIRNLVKKEKHIDGQ